MVDRPIKIMFSEHGAWGEITWRGEKMPVKSFKIEVRAQSETEVTLTFSARYCDITYDPGLADGENERSD